MRTADDPRGYYHLLGIGKGAAGEEVRVAFRHAAKRYHPDQGGPEADESRFQALREAYDVLKDPAKRLAYDSETAGQQYQWPGDTNRGAPIVDTSRGGRWTVPVLAGLLAVAVLSAGFVSYRLSGRDAEIEQLQHSLNRARQDHAEITTRLRARNFENLDRALELEKTQTGVFHASIHFDAGAFVLAAKDQANLDRDLLAMTDIIRRIPDNRDWLVLIDAYAPQAAADEGVDVEPWEAGLLRLATSVDHLVQLGLPADRIAARFQAGFSGRAVPRDLNKLELKLLCCLR